MPVKSSAKRTTRLVYGAFVLLVALFTFSNIWQVAWRVFGPDAAEAPASMAVGGPCGTSLSAEIRDIERSRLVASTEKDGPTAKERYGRERSPQKGASSRICEADPHGTEALAALARFDRAAEAHAVRESSELSPVRLAAQSFIRGPNE